MDYPKHLSEKIREEVAVSYLKHELKKIFPSIDKKEIKNLMKCKTLSMPRDFWNGFHGIAMGFKLNIGLIYAVTAENIEWKKIKVSVNDLYFGTKIKELEKIIDDDNLSVKNVLKNLEKKDKVKKELLEKYEKIKKENPEWNKDLIIVKEKSDGEKKFLGVYDGHNRLLEAILENKKNIEVYVGKFKNQDLMPKNYWLPTSLLMDNLYFVYEAIKNKDEKLFKKQMAVIKNMLKNSESGKIEFLERVLTSKKEIREKILKVLNF
jgi:hypothetical protein